MPRLIAFRETRPPVEAGCSVDAECRLPAVFIVAIEKIEHFSCLSHAAGLLHEQGVQIALPTIPALVTE